MRVYAPAGGTGDLKFLYAEIFEDRSYEQEGVALAGVDVVLDVGASVRRGRYPAVDLAF